MYQGSQKDKARLCGTQKSGQIRLKSGKGAKHNSPVLEALERGKSIGESNSREY